MLVVCTETMLPQHRVQPDIISPAEQALLDSWLPAQEDNPAAGKPCLKQQCMHDTLLTFAASLNAQTFEHIMS